MDRRIIDLGVFMKEEGLPVPANCAAVDILGPIDGVFQIRYTINLTPDELAAYGRVMVKMAEAVK